MKKTFISFVLCMVFAVLAPLSYGEPAGDATGTGDDAPIDPRAQGVAGGGAGGLPNAATVGVSSISIDSLTVGTMSLEPKDVEIGEDHTSIDTPTVSATSFDPQSKPSLINMKPERLVLDRDQMLDAINGAFNRTDIEMSIEKQAATIRILSIDLKNKTLHGMILESNTPILLIDESKKGIRN